MFVAIQKIQLKKSNGNGAYKEFTVESMSFSINGVPQKEKYSYSPKYDSGKFERPHREAYKFSLHQNYREGSKVKAKQCVLGTIDYYAIAEGFGLYDYVISGIERASKMFGRAQDELWPLVEAKFEPLREKIQREYRQSAEYKTVREREKVQENYRKAKTAFAKEYSVDENEYDFCFNVFGEVMNQEYLNEIKRREDYSSYSNFNSGNYDDGNYYRKQDHGSYFNLNSGNYTEDEKQDLKKFYKVLCLKFHPDRNPDKDTTKEMQLLNKLKGEWNL